MQLRAMPNRIELGPACMHVHGAMQGNASPLHNHKIILLILSLLFVSPCMTPTMAAITHHVHWGVQLWRKAPGNGPWDKVLPQRCMIVVIWSSFSTHRMHPLTYQYRNSSKNSVSYTHLTLPTIYSV